MGWTVEDLYDYQEKALETAIYPNRKEYGGLVYATLGLVGEIGEVGEKFFVNDYPDLASEMGDSLWYLNAFADEIGEELGEWEFNLDEMLHTADLPWSYPTDPEKSHAALVVQVGLIANCVKKGLRDDGGVLTEERRKKLVSLGFGAFHLWREMCQSIRIDSHIIAAQNLNKLFDRKDRGVLGGDGDKR